MKEQKEKDTSLFFPRFIGVRYQKGVDKLSQRASRNEQGPARARMSSVPAKIRATVAGRNARSR